MGFVLVTNDDGREVDLETFLRDRRAERVVGAAEEAELLGFPAALGLCEWAMPGPPYDGCDRDADAFFAGGEALCWRHGEALYGRDR